MFSCTNAFAARRTERSFRALSNRLRQRRWHGQCARLGAPASSLALRQRS